MYLIAALFLAALCSSWCALSLHLGCEYPHTQGSLERTLRKRCGVVMSIVRRRSRRRRKTRGERRKDSSCFVSSLLHVGVVVKISIVHWGGER
jgi:hypothetical protein